MRSEDHHVTVINKKMESKIDQIDRKRVPQHIAIIMDGNGRWAKKTGHERTFGHKNALKAVRAAIEACRELGIPYLTLYAFSSENWNRPKLEVSLLMTLLAQTIQKEIKELHQNNVRLNVIGNVERLPQATLKELKKGLELTQNNTGSTLTLALSYGSKEEILSATKSIAQSYKNGEISLEEIDEQLFEQHLYTRHLPMVDLMIRTSGEERISNFLLWQIAYAELYFTDTLWPDFTHENLYEAVLNYQGRERRFGKTSEQLI
ncbi:Undecaprenyl pyrophosphate synthase [Weeksella virosa]|uniref:Isoprenyl transferase n=2 Tax=Weeksellaceae TaxID=2762318 RepID=F0P2H8_WEEVC|nr:isoprenyl transferase [Weeksella virosa]ADX67817.1 Undecaprenyl pyrophosphate synthase [Weeksella virosa DSM 16922]SUP54120.1 Undecaprenyl pyrophosphate synthase [Weeksella virosa]VEH64556.1 Undecaprenyl pyrophosphate synthase [Weeksella virosa]